MPDHRGKQKRAQKQKKKREGARKARAGRVSNIAQRYAEAQARGGGAGPPTDLTEDCGYDPNHAPDVAAWLDLDEKEQMERVAKYHELAAKSGDQPPNVQRHVGMHVLVEQQIAHDVPASARRAMARLRRDGMTRHDAVHALGFVLTEHMRKAMESQTPVDEAAYGRELEQLTVARWLKMARAILG
jgi:Domain of unknown function (DUF1841)